MAQECAYSFYDLFKAAFRRAPKVAEINELNAALPAVRNKLVKKWARIAGWYTCDRVGSDGEIYTAFAPIPF